METPIVWKDRPVYLDPVLDKMMGVIVELAAQVYIMKDRMMIMERLLEDKHVMSSEDIEKWQPTPEQQAELRAKRDKYMSTVFRSLAEDVS